MAQIIRSKSSLRLALTGGNGYIIPYCEEFIFNKSWNQWSEVLFIFSLVKMG